MTTTTPTIRSPNNEISVPLSVWCEGQGISESNARGYYIPKDRVPGAFKLGRDWYVPQASTLRREGKGGRPRKS